jgi:hypothetical protein
MQVRVWGTTHIVAVLVPVGGLAVFTFNLLLVFLVVGCFVINEIMQFVSV